MTLTSTPHPERMQDRLPPTPSLAGLFLGFLWVGLRGFGGVLPWARLMIVERRAWLNAREFADLLGLCQFLPGPNVINLAVALGSRHHGWRGALAALAGLLAAPIAIVIGLGVIYGRFMHVPAVGRAFTGLSAAAAALVLATAIKIAAPLCKQPWAILVGAATFSGVAILHLPLPLVLAVMAPASVLFASSGQVAVNRR